MVLVGRVVVRSENGVEDAARTFMDFAQELPFLRVPVPAGPHPHPVTVAQHKPRDIDRIRCRVLAASLTVVAVYIATRIAAEVFDSNDGDAEVARGGWLHVVALPQGECDGTAAGQ